MKIVAIIQARMGSTRLPGKVLMDLRGKTVLARVVDRLRRAKLVDEITVATTVSVADDAIVRECRQLKVKYFRGSERRCSRSLLSGRTFVCGRRDRAYYL